MYKIRVKTDKGIFFYEVEELEELNELFDNPRVLEVYIEHERENIERRGR